MQVFGVNGPATEQQKATSQIVRHLGDHGTVGVVRDIPESQAETLDPYRKAGAAITYGRTANGWIANEDGQTLDHVLDRLATQCEFAVVLGYPEAALPRIVLGEQNHEGPVLIQAAKASDLDMDDIAQTVRELEPRETLESLVRDVTTSPDEVYAGAVATFTGRVRAKDDPDDDRTEHLAFERYDEVVAERMTEIRSNLEARDGVYAVRLHHKTGILEAGEDIVFVVVLAGHRTEAFAAVEDGINRLKEVVPFFKKEVTVEDEFWAHEGP